jgi:hypothetical protein
MLTVIQVELDVFSYLINLLRIKVHYIAYFTLRSFYVVKLHSCYGTSVTAVNDIVPTMRLSYLYDLAVSMKENILTKKDSIRNAVHEMLICSDLLLNITKLVVSSYCTYFPQTLWEMVIWSYTYFTDICHQVLDLYSQPQTSKSPDSPPLLPSTRSPTMKKERMPQPISPVLLQLSPVPSGTVL